MITIMWEAFLSLSLFLAVVLAQNDQITHLMLNDANLVETQQGYGVMAPNLANMNWKTVSVNGNRIQIIGPNCQVTAMTLQQLASSQQQQNTLDEARQFLALAQSIQPQSNLIYRSGVAKFSMRGNSATMKFARNIGTSSFNSNGLSLTKYDNNNMSIGKSSGLSSYLNRIFITGDVVTFVYNDGRVNMKPANCLESNENQLVQELKREANQAQVKFNNNMNQFSRNMQQSMQNMNQNSNNMFNCDNFPINNNRSPDNSNNNSQQQQSGQHQTHGSDSGIVPEILSQATNLVRNLPILGHLTRGSTFGQA